MSPLAGIAMSFALVVILVLPGYIGGSVLRPIATPRPAPAAAIPLDRLEAAYIASVRQTSGSADPDALSARPETIGSYPRIYPDDRFVAKEVSIDHPVRPTLAPI